MKLLTGALGATPMADFGRREPREKGPRISAYANGCSASPSPYGCLKCPLAVCKYDDPTLFKDDKRRTAGQAIAQALQGSPSIDQAARHLRVSQRTIYRSIARSQNP